MVIVFVIRSRCQCFSWSGWGWDCSGGNPKQEARMGVDCEEGIQQVPANNILFHSKSVLFILVH